MGHREIISTPEVRQVGMMGVRKKLLTRSLKPQTSNQGFRDKRSVTHCSCSTFYFKKIIEQDKLSCTGKKLCVSMLINQMVLLDLFCRTIPPPNIDIECHELSITVSTKIVPNTSITHKLPAYNKGDCKTCDIRHVVYGDSAMYTLF